MTDETLDLKATLVPVGREIQARPGDRIIVAAGVAVGVYTGRKPSPPPAAEGGTPAAPPPKPKPKQHRYGLRRVAENGKPNREKRDAMREEVMRAFAAHGGELIANDLSAIFGRTLSSTGEMYYFRAVIAELDRAGRLERGGAGGKGTIYILKEPELETA